MAADRVHRRRLDIQNQKLEQFNAQLEEQVAKQTDELRRLAQRLQHLREEERVWMAHEIHDSLGQELTALRFAAATARSRYEAEPLELGSQLRRIDELLERTATSMRRIIQVLRPRVLDEFGHVG